MLWDVTHINEDTWAIRDLEKVETAGLMAICARRNGNIALLAKEYGKPLYYAEIPSE